MTEEISGGFGGDVTAPTIATPAPVEQKSTETVVQPNTPSARREARYAPKEPAIVTPEPAKVAEPSNDDKANESARQFLQEKYAREQAEAKIKELTPKVEAPTNMPDINDQKTWGTKYQDKPNDLETFLKARDEWAKAEGKKEYTELQNREKAAETERANRAATMQKIEKSRASHQDFNTVVGSISQIVDGSPILMDFMVKNPMGMEVIYELGKNPAILQQIVQGDDWAAREQLINMAARLKAPKPVQITKAPEPITPVGSRDTGKVNLAQLAAKNTGEYIAEANRRELAKLRRH